MGSPAKNQTFALDEELWFGDHDDADAENRAAASLAAVGARIVGAKPFPVAARRLDELTRNPSTRIEQVVNVLESDPALSARLLRLVNSAGYGLKVRCTSVRHAAVLVGTRRLNQVATTAAILDLFDGTSTQAMDLLEHAAVVGSLCRYLAVHQGLPHDELFTCGFLHDIGKLMLLDAERERYAELLNEFGHAPDQIHLAERKLFGFDHAILGAHVLTAWNIPEPVPRVIAWHHAPARAMQDTVASAMVQTLRLADLLAYVLALPDTQQAVQLAAASEAAGYLEISDVQLSAMWNDLVALRDRSRARSHGEPELEVMVPKVEVPSLRARASITPSQKPGKTGRPLHEVPSHFPCSVCAKPSFGNVCAACGGHVCPAHQVGADEWCSVCAREFVRFKKTAELSGLLRAGVGTLVGSTLAIALYSASRAPDAGVETLILAPVMVLALWAVVLPVAYRLWQKLAFLERRRKARLSEPRASVARPRTAHMPSAASASALIAASPVEAPPQPARSPVTTSSELDADGGHDTPLSMAPLSTAPSVPPALSPALSSPPRSSRLRSAAELPVQPGPPDSVPPLAVAPASEVDLGARVASMMVPESLLPDSDFLSVRPTTVSVALAAHFGKNGSRHPSPRSTAPRLEDEMHSRHPERSSLVSERPRLSVGDSILDTLPRRPTEPVRIQEVASVSAPADLNPAPSASAASAAPVSPAASLSPAEPISPAASVPMSVPAPHISMGPPAVLSFAPEGSLAPGAVSVHPEPVRASSPAPHISMGPPEHVSLPPEASIPPAQIAASAAPAAVPSAAPAAVMSAAPPAVPSAAPAAAMSAAPVAMPSAAPVAMPSAAPVAAVSVAPIPPATSVAPVPPATSVAPVPPATSVAPIPPATSVAPVPPATSVAPVSLVAPPVATPSARPQAVHVSEAPGAHAAPAPVPAPAGSAESQDETPDSGAQLVAPPVAPRVYNSPLARSAAIGCARTSLQACVGASGPKISYRPPEIAVPGSRESA